MISPLPQLMYPFRTPPGQGQVRTKITNIVGHRQLHPADVSNTMYLQFVPVVDHYYVTSVIATNSTNVARNKCSRHFRWDKM